MSRRHALLELTVARTKEFVREPEAIFWVFAFPLLLALALGFAFRESAPEKIPIAVVDECAASVRQALGSSPVLKTSVITRRSGANELTSGRVSLVVDCQGGISYAYDPKRPDARALRLEVDEALQRSAGRRDVVTARERHVSAPGSRYIDFLIPGLLGMNLMGTGMWGVGFSVVTARTRKLLKRLVATPMKKRDYLLAQILSRLVFLVFEVVALTLFGWLAFGVPLRGSIFTFAFICVLSALSFSGLGLLVASRARTIEAVSGLMNLVMVPMWVCSGVFFSSARFPDAAQPFIRILPLTATNDALRAVMLQGAGIPQIAFELTVLLVCLAVSFLLAIRLFRWE